MKFLLIINVCRNNLTFSKLLFWVCKYRGCHHQHNHLLGLDLFEMSESHSRAIIQCDHCGLEIIRHNLKVHTKRHNPGSVVKERIKRQYLREPKTLWMQKLMLHPILAQI